VSAVDAFITFCPTRDLEATARFYEEVVGLELALDQGACRIYRVREGAYLGFCARDDLPRETGEGLILTLVTDDVDGRVAALAERGATIETPPSFNERYRIYHAFLRDPNGYRLEVQRFEDPRWGAP
jgi:predicted enzyme related to lactoylglutathione lyase